jgi:hypothetical protein
VIDKRSQVIRIKRLIEEKVLADFFGEIIIKMEHGNIVCVELNENHRLDEMETQKLVQSIRGNPNAEIRGVKSTRDPGISLVRVGRRGSLEEIIPAVK